MEVYRLTGTTLSFEDDSQLFSGAAGLAVHLALVGVRLAVGGANWRELQRAGLGAAAHRLPPLI